MGVTITDVLLFGKAQSDDVDNATLVIYRRNILRWSALGGYLDVIVKGVSPLSLPDAIADSLSYVKAFGGTEQRNLPDGYIERQFIYMMDGSYIRVEDLLISAGYKVEFDFQTTSLGSTLRNYIGGRADGVSAGGGFRLSKLANSNNDRVILYGFESGTEYYDPTTQFTANTRYKYTYDNGVCTLESGGSVISTKTFTVTDNTSTVWGINDYYNGTWASYHDGIYVYSVKVWNPQGELVMNLVPAVQRGTVPVVGFYDTVTGGFRTPTAGTFAAGGEAVPTPDAPMDIVSNNGVVKYSSNMANMIADNLAIGYYTSASGTVLQSDYNFIYNKYIPVKPNTTYTLSFSDGLYFASISEYSTADNSGFIQRTSFTSSSLEAPFDLTNCTLTTGATTNYIRFGCNMYKNITLTNTIVLAVNYMLVQGSAQPYIPYGQIYADGTVETINVHGKNLFDKDSYTEINAFVNADTGVLTQGSPGEYTQYSVVIPCKPNTTYTISGRSISAWGAFTSSNIGTTATSYNKIVNGSITTGANDKYLIGLVRANKDVIDYRDTLQIEQGSTATEYEPYYNGGTATAEMLLKVGDYQDVQSIIDGVVTRNVGVKVLDGTETWYASTSYPGSCYTNDVGRSFNGAPMFVSHFQTADSLTNYAQGKAYRENFSFNLWYGDTKATAVSDLTTFLAAQYAAGTPVTVIYPLAQAVTEQVAPQVLNVQTGDNVLEITQASLNNLELEAQYQAAVSLTIQEVQDANLDPNVEVTIN